MSNLLESNCTKPLSTQHEASPEQFSFLYFIEAPLLVTVLLQA